MKRKKHPPLFSVPLDCVNFPVRRCHGREKAEKRICIMRLGAAGDIVMGTPLLTALRKAYPNGHFTWIVEHSHRAAIEAHPFVDEVILWDGSWWKKELPLPLLFLQAARFAWQMRQRHFDVFLNFNAKQWAFLARFANARLSVGVFDTFSPNENQQKVMRFYDVAYAKSEVSPHRTDQHLFTLNALGLPQPPPAEKQMMMGYTARDEAVVGEFLHEHGLENTPFVVIAPLTTWPSRCWPAERYAALADRLIKNKGMKVVLIGSASEKGAVQVVADAMHEKAINAGGGQLTFRQMAALIARAALLISGDTGPMHVAGAVGTPFVALFGPTPVEKRAPLMGRGLSLMHPVPCGPCDLMECPNAKTDFMRCMRLISVEEAFVTCLKIFDKNIPKD